MNKILKKIFIGLIIFIIFMFIIGACGSEIEDPASKETTAETTTIITIEEPEEPKSESSNFNPEVFKNSYAEIITTKPIWIENNSDYKDGWYVAFNCYNTSNRNLEFLIDLNNTEKLEIWETVYRDSDLVCRCIIGTDKDNPPKSIDIYYSIWISGGDQTIANTITERRSFIIQYD